MKPQERGSAGQAVESLAGDPEVLEPFFLSAKLAGVRDQGATGAPRGVLHVQHFVEENVLHDELRNARAVHAAVQDDLVRARIVATELAAPSPSAPTDVRAAKFARKVFSVETVEEGHKIVVTSLRRHMRKAHAVATHAANASAGPLRTSIEKVRASESTINSAPIDPREKQGRRTLQYFERRASQQVRKAHEQHVIAAPDGQHEAAVGIELHLEMRGTTVAANTGEHAQHERFPAGDTRRVRTPRTQFFRLTGGGAAFFFAFSASFWASCVPSMASSRFSL